MSSIHETAYPRFKPYLTVTDLNVVYTPTAEENLFAKKKTRNKLNQLGLLIQLKIFQKLGFFLKFNKIPTRIITHIIEWTGLKKIDINALKNYDNSTIKNNHQTLIRKYLNVSSFNNDAATILFNSALKASETSELLPDIINAMLEQIINDGYELPAFSTFESIAKKARTQANKQYFKKVKSTITPDIQKLINTLFVVKPNENYSLWYQFKQEPKKPTPKRIRKFLQHHREIKEYYEQLQGYIEKKRNSRSRNFKNSKIRLKS